MFAIEPNPSLGAAVALLDAAGLPSADLCAARLRHFFFCGPRDAPTGLVGIEIFERDALLRSLTVAPAARRSGLGSTLVRHAERHASERGVHSLYLLTLTARSFFETRGYRVAARESCPDVIRATSEFATLCPASSIVMRKILTD
jgi:amino-acid N-acetyltransferase